MCRKVVIFFFLILFEIIPTLFIVLIYIFVFVITAAAAETW